MYITDFFVRSNGVTTSSRTPIPASLSIIEQVPLAPRTTLRVGGPATFFGQPQDTAQYVAQVRWAQAAQISVLPLGEGSNVLVADAGFEGLVISPQGNRPIAFGPHLAGVRRVVLDAAMPWDEAVRATCEAGLWGVEALAGIPGLCGAAPVQNIGAYGQEAAQTLVGADVLDLHTLALTYLPSSAMGLGYRTSHFKVRDRGRYIIMATHHDLHETRPQRAPYAGLTAALEEQGLDQHQVTPTQVAEVVRTIRRRKGMVWEPQEPSFFHAGSFFENPVVPRAQREALMAQHPKLPYWPTKHGDKLAAAYLIEASGFRKGWSLGFTPRGAGLSPLHALCLGHRGSASAAEIVIAAQTIYAQVLGHTGVALRAEVRIVGGGNLRAPFHAGV